MNRRAFETIRQYNMIQRGGRVSVGVSGGADSVALLHFLHSHRQQLCITVSALHLNHCLRGEESERDESFVRELCRRWSIPLEVRRSPVGELAALRGQSVEECARCERYAFFGQAAGEGQVATAHTLTDSVETLLFNLTRGAGPAGLCGIPPVRGNIIRPLIGCSRALVETYCAENGLDFVTDSTNLSETFSRNRIRLRVLPVLRGINPALEAHAGSAMEQLREDGAYLEELAAQRAEQLRGARGLRREGLLETGPPLRRRILIRLLRDRGIAYSAERLLRMEDLAGQERAGALQLSGDWFWENRGEELLLVRRERLQAYFCLEVDLGRLEQNRLVEFTVFSGKRVQLLRMDYEFYEESKKDSEKPLKNALDYDRMNKIVSMRQRIPGDAMRPAGRGCTKTLRKLFGEEKLDPGQRSRRVVIAAAGDRVCWVEGFGPDESCCVQAGKTRRVLMISILEEER